MTPKRLLSGLTTDQQQYYIFLAKECFAAFSNAEYNFSIYRYAACYAWLMRSSEFFWKSLSILSGNYFELRHEASQTDMKKISKAFLSNDERIKAYNILSQFSDIKRNLARYGYYEKETHVTTPPNAMFDRGNTETDLNKVGWLIRKLREIHYYQIFDPPIKIGILSGYVHARKEKPCSYYPHSNYGLNA